MADLTALDAWAEGFASAHLTQYIARLERRSGNAEVYREFNDPLWKTISLTPFETLIVDSPLFQRLRRIRQLGVVHLVYPGAVHTRFEHTMGVLHQMQRLIDSIRVSGGTESITEPEAAFLRLAALCHDIGHGVMSHVSETAVTRFEEVDDLRKQFGKKNGTARPNVSELIAYQLVNSPSFRNLVEIAIQRSAAPHPPSNVADWICKTFLGHPVVPSKPLLSELISGPFDADKLDYMQRDAYMTGIPLVTDVPRLIRKVRALSLSQSDLPDELAEATNPSDGPHLVFGLAFSGSRTLDELLLARILLFDKVYRHQKVRAIEGMVTRLIQLLKKCYTGSAFELPYLFTDDELLIADQLVEHNPRFLIPENIKGSINHLCSSLKDRNLFVRACVLGLHLPADGYGRNVTKGMQRLVSDLEEERKAALEERLAREVMEIISIIKPEEKAWTIDRIRPLIWVAAPSADDHSKKIAHAWLIRGSSSIIAYQKYSDETSNWATAYLSKKDVGFVFCDPELKMFTALAAEKVLALPPYSLRLPKSAQLWVKEEEDLDYGRKRLRDSAYYKKIPFHLRPLLSRLVRNDISRKCDAVRLHLQGYSVPPRKKPRKKSRLISTPELRRRVKRSVEASYVSNELIVDWLTQFDDEGVIDCAILAISKVEVIGRQLVNEAVAKFIDENPMYSNCVPVSLGGPQDSGSVAVYHSRDSGLQPATLETALASDAPVLFVDDFIGSGKQSRDIVSDLLGLPTKLNEKHRQTLSKDLREKLRSRSLGFVFAAGWSSGANGLAEFASECGLTAKVHVHKRDSALPSIMDEAIMMHSHYEEFRAKCQRIGESLLRSEEPKWDSKLLEERALGYGNKGLLVVTSQNTPSQTLTCIWSGGFYNGFRWIPLLPRLKKP